MRFSGEGNASPSAMENRAEAAAKEVGVVIATHNRVTPLMKTLGKLGALAERPPVVVVDNGSSDGTAEAVGTAHPGVAVMALSENLGGAARTVGARALQTPFVAFSDDDSWWAPGSLALASQLLISSPRLALVAARVLVGAEEREDPVCREMARSPLPAVSDLPGPSVLGFIACGAVVRRSAFLDAGGFHPRFGIGGEEELLALDLAAAGWGLAYVEDVVAHHHPSPTRNPAARRRVQVRNALWCAWLRRPAGSALRRTARLVRSAPSDQSVRAGLAEALAGLPWVGRQRRPVPAHLDAAVRALGG